MNTYEAIRTLILSIIFFILLLPLISYLILVTGFKEYSLISYFVLLATGIFLGFICKYENKKLLKSLSVTSVFFLIYLAVCFLTESNTYDMTAYLLAAFNLFLGTIIGAMLSITKKPKKKGSLK